MSETLGLSIIIPVFNAEKYLSTGIRILHVKNSRIGNEIVINEFYD